MPGRYNLPSFLSDVYKKPNTYRFKSDGRRLEPMPQIGKGEYLLPGAYSFEDFSSRLDFFSSKKTRKFQTFNIELFFLD